MKYKVGTILLSKSDAFPGIFIICNIINCNRYLCYSIDSKAKKVMNRAVYVENNLFKFYPWIENDNRLYEI